MGKIFRKGKKMVQNKLIALIFSIVLMITPAKSFDLEKYYNDTENVSNIICSEATQNIYENGKS